MEPKTIVNAVELRTDQDDEVKNWFEIVVEYDDGTRGELRFSLEGARHVRGFFDSVPEIDGEKW